MRGRATQPMKSSVFVENMKILDAKSVGSFFMSKFIWTSLFSYLDTFFGHVLKNGQRKNHLIVGGFKKHKIDYFLNKILTHGES